MWFDNSRISRRGSTVLPSEFRRNTRKACEASDLTIPQRAAGLSPDSSESRVAEAGVFGERLEDGSRLVIDCDAARRGISSFGLNAMRAAIGVAFPIWLLTWAFHHLSLLPDTTKRPVSAGLSTVG